MGVWPGVTARDRTGLDHQAHRGRRCGPFAVGFQVAGWAAVIAYVICCRMFPEFMNMPYVYYVNDVEPYILNTEYQELYMLGLVFGGCIWGIPQLLVALAGGGLAALAGPRTIVIGSRT